MTFKPGDTVRIPGELGKAKIRAILTDMHGALLERSIGGRRKWNLSDLRLVERAKIRKKKAADRRIHLGSSSGITSS